MPRDRTQKRLNQLFICFSSLPYSVTLFTSYSPHLYIQSQSEKDETFQKEKQRDESGFPPLRFLLSGKNCQTLKKTLLSDTDLKFYQSPNVLTGLAGVIASQVSQYKSPSRTLGLRTFEEKKRVLIKRHFSLHLLLSFLFL